jgi:raffinose/stachyose/melibiose transport system permease protein
MAGLQNVDKSLYEAAELDGAGAVGKFWYVTIPSLRNTLNVVISMIIIYGLKSFPLVWIMTQGGPFYRSELVATYIYRVAFTMNDISYATAASVILAVIIIFITFLFNMIREWGE